MKEKQIRKVVKGRYARIAKQEQESCCPGCACTASSLLPAEAIGYSTTDLEHVPERRSWGCGAAILPP